MLKKIDTGIFTRTDISDATAADLDLLSRLVDRSSDLENWLSSAEAKFEANKDDPDAAAAWLAAQCVREALRDNSAHDAALNALFLGMLLVRIEAKQHEKPAMIGRKVQDGQRKSIKSQGRLENDAAQRHRDWIEYAAALRRKWSNRHSSDRQIALAVSKHFGVKFETVKSALQKYRNSSR